MSTRARPRYVVDASIALKWYLADELFVDEADAILAAFGDGRIDLLAPQHIHYEVTNALRTAVARGRIPEDPARRAMTEFLQLDLPVVVGTGLVTRGWDAARQYGCALYDGLYVGLAEITGAPLIHADRRLRNALAGRFPLELWIEGPVLL